MTTTARRNTILIVGGLILLGVVGPMFLRPVVALRPVLDEKGQQVYHADGKPKRERDPIGQFKLNWDAYTIVAVGAACTLLGAGLALRDAVRKRRNRNPVN